MQELYIHGNGVVDRQGKRIIIDGQVLKNISLIYYLAIDNACSLYTKDKFNDFINMSFSIYELGVCMLLFNFRAVSLI